MCIVILLLWLLQHPQRCFWSFLNVEVHRESIVSYYVIPTGFAFVMYSTAPEHTIAMLGLYQPEAQYAKGLGYRAVKI